MAKQLISPFERHVEKGVLAIAGIILIAVIAKYLVTTPNRIELAGEMVAPGEIDRKVAEEAEVVRRMVSNKSATVDDFSPLLDDFTQNIDPFGGGKLSTQLSSAVAPAPEIPTIDPPGLTRGKTELVEVVKLTKPVTTSGHTTFNIGGDEVATNWVTVSSVFNRKAQEELQLRTYGSKWIKVTFGPAELQRRLRRADGSWSEDDWENIDAWPRGDTGSPPRFSLKDEDGEITIRNEDSNRAKKYGEAVGHRAVQLSYIRPLPPPEINGTPWTFPIVTTKRDVAKQDEEYISDDDPVPNPPLDPDRYPNMVSGVEAVVAVVEDLSPAEKVKQWFATAEQLLDEAERVQDPVLAVQAYNLCSDILLFVPATTADKTKAKKLQAVAEAKEKDIRFNILNERKRGTGGESGPQGGSVPGKIVRTFTDKQQLWAHDASPGSLEDGKTYQYRIRPVIFNPLFGVPGKFEDPTDALVPFIQGNWSEPSDPVTIEPSVTYFVKRGDERKNVANIEVYQWFHGVWVSNGKLKLGVGQSVAGKGRADIPDPFTEGEVFRAPISFDAHATIVDIDFDRTLPTYDIKRGGVHIGSLKKTTGVVFLDARGELHERFVILDKRHPDRKKARDRVFRAPKGTR